MNQTNESSAEQTRLQEDREGRAAWKKWGPYLSERQWGTVREDYSSNGMPGITSPTITLNTVPTGGVRTASRASPITASCSASRWRCGTGVIRS
jgi:hypothetical protein